MSGALRELIAFFGVEVDDKALDKAGEKMESLAGLAERAGATLGLAFGIHEISEFIQSQIELAVEIGHTSEMLGLGVEDLQAFQYAAANAGLGADEANTSLRFLNKNLGEAASGNATAAQAFQKLGVTIKDADGNVRPVTGILSDVADGISKLPSPALKTAKAMELFGRAGARMIPLLNKGAAGIDELYAEFDQLGGGISEEYVKVAEEAHHETLKLGLVFKGLKATIGAALIPSFGWLVSKITEAAGWFREFSKHSYIVQTALGTLGAIVAGLVVVWGILNFEVLLVVLAIALLVLVVDDVYTALMGGKSVIGDFIDSLFGIGSTQEVVEAIRIVAQGLWADLGELWDATKKLVSAFGGLEGQTDPTRAGLDALKATIQAVGDVVHYVIVSVELLEKALTKVVGVWSDFKKEHPELAKVLGDAGSSLVNPGGNLVKSAGSAISGAQALFGEPSIPAPGPSRAVDGDVRQVTNHTIVNVDVATTGSPHEAGKAVASGVRNGLNGSDLADAYAGSAGNGGS